jgi:glycosyltransferase involved in cell wall biosynthesis
MRAAIVIPAYNEAATIRGLVERSLRQCALVIVVDDGSSDGTSAALEGLPAQVLRHATNEGKAASLWDGIQYALARNADAVVTLDGDGQHQPEDASRLLLAAAEHPHRIIVGARLIDRESYPRARRLANRFADFGISWAAGHPIADSQSGQRLYPAALLRQLRTRHDAGAAFTFESEALIHAAKLGFTTVAVPIKAVFDPTARPSHFRPVRDIARIVAMGAGHLLAMGLYPMGLWRSLRFPARIADALPGGAEGSDLSRRA